ncbi:MAG: 23S rRNA (guanosine(2251)-2'-O)-methyltransferase RlmB [Ruminococcus sp.]|nr:MULTISPECIES: 23S rRNA (guanosine(2251)-2'-O)-methyltransferase RlmB [Ruminococcus]MCI5597953.1 23S rRNA (guanosine(2251)-2'-O)-methyltransferase RlmB [Ruminococcus sp.]MCI5617665.1 23S rRNA (guanosine(2251)-2'-O)-methyltransferase RlmB [Ruminococcus sp.]MCI6505160.1 23S rRNA (guanosine(2251)-2'-O)-methyltransferase RlmB [Ruminococcus sp.]MDD6709996.1 23S rRNA (guanosine(2251)-2'-O)-methyltransferase RlmB [Ruminococcus sp.]MDY3661475.1 23S rRNA (guanosine(2251)-2'-O)-methyltransferase RlmB 
MEQNKQNLDNQRNDIIAGRNPVMEAIRSGRSIESILVAKGERSGSVVAIIAKAKQKNIPVKDVDSKKLDFLAKGVNHQGIVAQCAVKEYSALEDIFALAEERGESPFIIVLDKIEDPHNLGAIIRTAECAGAHGVIIPERRSAGLSYTVEKTSAGALEYMPVVRVKNISAVLQKLKDKGIWVYGADMDGEHYKKVNFDGAVALVIGNEGKGISPLVAKDCDVIVSLPMKGKINSLNASVAAGILMYEIADKR